ncbi:transmembrane protein 216 isoform X2 [Scleropages formosus]|uniref:transmembrane protein 216 isoform X2 n=1 Tax=Scleropages formosus TaxID=113540 RepID=UPI0010FA6E53|nr:transmembrane protein 216-like isoform X2 [Scleropages formosus]
MAASATYTLFHHFKFKMGSRGTAQCVGAIRTNNLQIEKQQLLHDKYIFSLLQEKMKLYPFCVYIYVTDMYWAPRYYSASSSTVRQLSSVPLQVLLTLNGWYFGGFFIAELLMFVYKGVLLPYPPGNLVLDLMLLFLFLGLEILRIFYGSKGNLCEQTLATVLSVGILVPCAVLSVYFLLLQTFVLRLEVIVNALLLCFYGFELLLCLTGLIAFSRG